VNRLPSSGNDSAIDGFFPGKKYFKKTHKPGSRANKSYPAPSMEKETMFKTHDRVELVNARIVDVESGCYYPPQVSLIIQNGKITAMPGLPGEPDGGPADAVIDLHGLTVIPGLFNTHCHLQFIPKGEIGSQQLAKNLRDCVERGVTNVRDTLCYDLQDNRNWMEKIQRGEIQGPRIHQSVHVSPVGGTYAPRSNPITRFSFSMLGVKVIDFGLKTAGVVAFRPDASLQEIRDAVDRAVDERGAAAIKFCDQHEHFMTYKPGAKVMTDQQLGAALDQSVRRGMPTTMHNVTVTGFRQGVKAGVTSLAHLPFDSCLDDADAALLLSSHTYIEPTLSVGYFMSYSMKGSPVSGHPEIQRLDRFREQGYRAIVEETWLPELQDSRFGLHTSLKKGELKIFGILDISKAFTYYSKLIPVGGENLRLLVKHGAASRMGCGNDAGAANCSAAAIHHELAMFDFTLNLEKEILFTPVDLLRTATIQSARSMGVADQFGSIQSGKVADLVILEGDPLQDFHLVGKPVRALFMDGNLMINHCGLEAIYPNVERDAAR
jgi:imidazolonepropionase-like amidohydrolase